MITKLRENIIQAAIIWRKTDSANLEFTEATGNLTIAVAEYLQELEGGDAPDKLLRYSEIIQILDKEENWSESHKDDFSLADPEYIAGFLAGIRQAKYLITQLAHLNEEGDSFPISAPWGEPLDYDVYKDDDPPTPHA